MDVVLRLTDAERDRIDQLVLAAAPRETIMAEMCKSAAGRLLWAMYWEQALDDSTDIIDHDGRIARHTEDASDAN
jgi:TolB-like protein